jgi:hypothetical protein
VCLVLASIDSRSGPVTTSLMYTELLGKPNGVGRIGLLPSEGKHEHHGFISIVKHSNDCTIFGNPLDHLSASRSSMVRRDRARRLSSTYTDVAGFLPDVTNPGLAPRG